MAYKHGVYIQEQATSLLSPVQVESAIPFVVGTAPVNMCAAASVNTPVLCTTWAEAVAAFGYCPPVEANGIKQHAFTLCEFMKSHFALYGVAPVVLVNVLDPEEHAQAESADLELSPKCVSVIRRQGILPASVEIAKTTTVTTPAQGGGEPEVETTTVTYEAEEDYVLSFDGDGYLVVTGTQTGGEYNLPTSLINTVDDVTGVSTAETLTISYSWLDPSEVDAGDITGSEDEGGNRTGLMLAEDVFPRLRVTPGIIAAPGYSQIPAVAAEMAARARSINGLFSAIAVADIPSGEGSADSYADAPAWKNDNNYASPWLIACWPKLSLDGVQYWMSTQLASLMAQVDGDNSDVPYVSPSNKNFQCTASVLEDGTEVWLNTDSANYLNGNGIVTALNFVGGWKCWGNRTSCYPAVTDVKDSFIPLRRMFSWIGNSLVQTYWQRVDFPLTRRQVQAIVDSVNIWLNGLAARQYILGGRLEFLEAENPATSLMDGVATFHLYVTPPSPNREIEFTLEYDVSYLEALFG